MAIIRNLEDNVELCLCLKKGIMLDYVPQRSDYENWIPFILKIVLPERIIEIKEKDKATFSVYEVKKFIQELASLIEKLHKQESYKYNFYCSESFFELGFQTFLTDDVVEVEIWINKGIQSKGKVCGFDEGVKFVVNRDEINVFYAGLKNELKDVINL